MKVNENIKKEWQLIKQSAWLKALLFWLPALLALIFWAIFSAGIARDLPVGAVDLDNSVMSRGLIRSYDASPNIAINKHYQSVQQASEDLRSGSIYGLVIIPHDLSKNTMLGKSPQVTVFYNSQFILIGKIINSAVIQAHATYIANLEVFKDLVDAKGQLSQAIGEALPISQQVTPLFNKNTHYGQFLVSAVIPVMWQIIIIATVVLAFGIQQQNSQSKLWILQLNSKKIALKLLPYIGIFWLQGIVFISVFYGVLHWPMQGSWLVLIAAQLLLVLACTSVATLLYFLTLDVTRSMSFVAGFSAPAFAFMGVTFPASDMSWMAQFWRAVLPISHYIEIQIQQVSYAAALMKSSGQFLSLIAFSGCFYLSILLIRKHKAAALSGNIQDGHANTNVNVNTRDDC